MLQYLLGRVSFFNSCHYFSPNSVDETTDLNNTSSDNLHSVSSVERRRQINRYHTLSNKSNSSKRKHLRYNIDKYKLSKSGRKIKRRLQQQETPTPSEKVVLKKSLKDHNHWYLKIGEHLAQRYFHGDSETVKGPNELKYCSSKILCVSCMLSPVRNLSILQPRNEGSAWN